MATFPILAVFLKNIFISAQNAIIVKDRCVARVQEMTMTEQFLFLTITVAAAGDENGNYVLFIYFQNSKVISSGNIILVSSN